MDISHIFEPVPNADWLTTGLLFLGISLVIAISEWIRYRLNWPAEFTRKLVHILVGLLAFFLPLLLSTSLPIVILAVVFTLSNLLAIKLDLLKGMHGVRESYGTVYYPLALLLLTLFAWPEQKLIIIIAMLVLGLGDALAAIVGESLASPRTYKLVGDAKSFEGSATMLRGIGTGHVCGTHLLCSRITSLAVPTHFDASLDFYYYGHLRDRRGIAKLQRQRQPFRAFGNGHCSLPDAQSR